MKRMTLKQLLIATLLLYASTIFSQEMVGKITLQDGSEVSMYANDKKVVAHYYNFIVEGDMALTSERILFFDESNTLQKMKQKLVEKMEYGDHLYKNFNLRNQGSKRGRRLQEVIMENDMYVLTSYFSLANYFYVYRKSDLKMMERAVKHSKKKKTDYKLLEKVLPDYFPNCKEALEQIRLNIRNSDYKILYGNVAIADNKMFNGIYHYQCN